MDTPVIVEPEQISPPASPPVAPIGEDLPPGWKSWLSRNVLLPLTPVLVGAVIRFIGNGRLSLSAFDPGEAAFSFAAFCLLGLVAASRVDDPEYKHTASVAYIIGITFFMSMFALSVAESASHARASALAIQDLAGGYASNPLPAAAEIVALSREEMRLASTNRLSIILALVAVVGFVFVAISLAFRDKYRLGES